MSAPLHRQDTNPSFFFIRGVWQLLLVAVLAAAVNPAAFAATYRYSSSSNRIYIENGGEASLSDIKSALPDAPLDLVDAANAIWLLRANLIIEDGSTLRLHGEAVAGDVNELRLLSDDIGFVYVTAEYGNIDMRSTLVRSWNPATSNVDTEYATGRAFVRVRSFLDLDGVTARESRMDIVDSEVGFLGYSAAESYGLVWKVNGTHPNLYDLVAVRGDIRNSRIHHNYFGVYTYGHQGGQWTNNELDRNVQYGFDPHDDSDDLLIEGNNVHHNGNHGIIASMRCDSIVIRNNLSWANTGNGIMLHRSSNFALVEGNQSYENTDAGIALFGSENITVRNNVFRNNLRGIRLSVGANDNLFEDNEVANNTEYGLYFYKGSDIPEPNDNGRNKRNVFRANIVTGNPVGGINLKDSDNTRFVGNRFASNGVEISLENARDTEFINNRIPTNVTVILGGDTVDGSLYFSEQAQITLQLDTGNTARFESTRNAIFDVVEPIATVASGPDTLTQSSIMDLTPALIGGATTVNQRVFFVTPASGTAEIDATLWELDGAMRKTFTSRASAAPAKIEYVVGNLTPGVIYNVRRGAAVIRTLTASAKGRIRFLVPGTTGAVTFRVEPA